MLRVAGVLFVASTLLAQKQPFDASALLKIARISEPELSPDGTRWHLRSRPSISTRTRNPSRFRGAGARRHAAADHAAGKQQRAAALVSRFKEIAFVSDRGGSSQIWSMNANGSNAAQVTNLSTEADGVLFRPTARSWCSPATCIPNAAPTTTATRQRLDAEKKSKVKARVYHQLCSTATGPMADGAALALDLSISVAAVRAKDLTPGTHDVPPFSLGGPDDYAISPDSTEVCFAMNADPVPATSTNSDLFVVPIDGGESQENHQQSRRRQFAAVFARRQVSRLSHRRSRAGYESDRWRLHGARARYRQGRSISPKRSTAGWRASPGRPIPRGCSSPSRIAAAQAIQYDSGDGGGARSVVSGDSTLDDMQFTSDGKTMIYTRQSGVASRRDLSRAVDAAARAMPLTHLNDALLATISSRRSKSSGWTARRNARAQLSSSSRPSFRPTTNIRCCS